MSFVACFDCGKYWPVKNTARHRVPGHHDKTYRYNFESDVPDELEKEKPELKDFDPSYYQAKNLLVFPLDYIPDFQAFDVEAGKPLQLPDTILPARTPEEAEITGIVRHWDRVEIYVEEVTA